MRWTANFADRRIHGTTHRKPIEMFEEERELLIDHREIPPFILQERFVRHIAKDCMINFKTNRYSVPFRFVGKQVEVQSDSGLIRIYHEGHLIAVHSECMGTHQVNVEKSHYEGIYEKKDTSPFLVQTENPTDDVEVRDLAFYESLVEGGAQ
jgi:hypothetical protein